MKQFLKILTSCLPLLLIHLTLTIRIDDLHSLQQSSKFWMLVVLGIHVVKFSPVDEIKRVLFCKPMNTPKNKLLALIQKV